MRRAIRGILSHGRRWAPVYHGPGVRSVPAGSAAVVAHHSGLTVLTLVVAVTTLTFAAVALWAIAPRRVRSSR